MAPQPVPARLKYLNDSAHILATSAPSTSAYLMSRCNSLMFDNEVEQTDAHKRHACGACGNIMILNWTGTRKLEALHSQRRRRAVKSKVDTPSERTKVVIYKCGLCGSQTKQTFEASKDGSRNLKSRSTQPHANGAESATALSQVSSQSPTLTTTEPSAANASSKKRAKVRKHGGLQALLAKKKEADARALAGSFGLDFLDIMKKA